METVHIFENESNELSNQHQTIRLPKLINVVPNAVAQVTFRIMVMFARAHIILKSIVAD